MIIGLCGSAFPDVRRALQAQLPDAELVDVLDPAATSTAVDVLVPLGAEVTASLLDATAPRLVQQFGVGLQGVDMAAAAERGIAVANIPAGDTGNATAAAEIALLHMLMLLRRYPEARASVTAGRLGEPWGSTLAGKTVTTLGAGALATAVLARVVGAGAHPMAVATKPYEQQEGLHPWVPRRCYFPTERLAEALGRTEVLVICVPLSDATRNLVGRAALDALPEGAYLVNVARGGVIDYPALLAALRSGRLAGAGLDVAWTEPIDPADPLLEQNVTVTPHIGGVTVESYTAMARIFAGNARALVEGEPLAHRAD